MTVDSLPRIPLQRRTGVAVWKQIADVLTQEIRDRVYPANGCLPSESVLAARFDVNRHTLRQALASMREAGLLRIEQGRGAFVVPDCVDYTVARRTRWTENILRNQRSPSRRMLAGREEVAPRPVAEALRLPRGARVCVAEMLQEAGGVPIAVATMRFPAALFPGLLDHLAGGDSVTAALARYGIDDYVRTRNRITAQLPGEGMARLLQQQASRPVLCVESIDADTAGVPIKHGTTVFGGDRVQVTFDATEVGHD